MTAPRIIDRTRKSLGWDRPFQTRRQSDIRFIGIHHSATEQGTTATFENSWRNIPWTNGGYWAVILRNGDIEINYPYTTVTNGASGTNHNTLHICVVGNGSFTPEQESSLNWLVLREMDTLNIPVANVLGHNEFSGANTACPGRDMNSLRKSLANLSQSSTNTHTVRSGETLTSIARQHNTTVNAIVEANNLANPNLIRAGQVLTIPSGSTPTQSFFPATQAGGASFVDALNSIGVNSSFVNRQRIAVANGISGFTGTAQQNSQLLGLLRQGRLVRP